MNTKITIISFIFLSIAFSILIYISYILGFELKNIFAATTPIFVALIALISNQWGIYLNKQYDVKFYVNQKQIEEIDRLISNLENIQKTFYKLFDEYSRLRFDEEIMEYFLSEEYVRIRTKKLAIASQIGREIGFTYFSNYLLFSDETHNIYPTFSKINWQMDLAKFWNELKVDNTFLNKNVLNEIMPKYFGVFDEVNVNFLGSIINSIRGLNQTKEILLNGLYSKTK